MITMWLLVEAEQGMFPDERTVVVRTADGGMVSLFVPDFKVRDRTGQSLIEVNVLDSTEQHSIVQLPAASIEGSSVARVDRSSLRTTA